MEKYFKCRAPCDPPTQDDGRTANIEMLISEYEQYHQTLLKRNEDEGWASELRCYLCDRPVDVTKDTDVVLWWQVHYFQSSC
jgi:hypothetical protein